MQNVIALIIVAAAASYLAWRTWSLTKRRRKLACGSCSSCSQGDNTQARVLPLVTIEPYSDAQDVRHQSPGLPRGPASLGHESHRMGQPWKGCTICRPARSAWERLATHGQPSARRP